LTRPQGRVKNAVIEPLPGLNTSNHQKAGDGSLFRKKINPSLINIPLQFNDDRPAMEIIMGDLNFMGRKPGQKIYRQNNDGRDQHDSDQAVNLSLAEGCDQRL
jgi:hypothetical protein